MNYIAQSSRGLSRSYQSLTAAAPFISLLITLVDRYELIWQPRCLERFRVTLPATPRRIMKVLKRNNKQNALVRDGAPME